MTSAGAVVTLFPNHFLPPEKRCIGQAHRVPTPTFLRCWRRSFRLCVFLYFYLHLEKHVSSIKYIKRNDECLESFFGFFFFLVRRNAARQFARTWESPGWQCECMHVYVPSYLLYALLWVHKPWISQISKIKYKGYFVSFLSASLSWAHCVYKMCSLQMAFQHALGFTYESFSELFMLHFWCLSGMHTLPFFVVILSGGA